MNNVPQTKSGYLPSLDGWRCFAVLAVMLTHDFHYHFGRWTTNRLHAYGGDGVLLFFAISGLLICTRILEEEELLGRFDIRGFYVRRFFRIQPAAITYLATIALFTLLGVIHQGWKYWFGALFLYRNYLINVTSDYIGAAGFFTGHFWTLAVEEHFYLLLSCFLFLVRKRRIIWMSLGVVSLFAWPYFFPDHAQLGAVSAYRWSEFQLGFLLFPALLAVLYRNSFVRQSTERLLRPWLSFCLTIFIYICAVFDQHKGLAIPYLKLIELTYSFWVLATITHPESLTTRFLEVPAVRWVGRLSYSLYLWHVLFFRGVYPRSFPQPHSWLDSFDHAPLNYLAAFAFAAASYYLLEKPMMRFGHRLAPPATPGRLDLFAERSFSKSEGLSQAHNSP